MHKISPFIVYLMRGQVFTIAGKKIFTFGGAQNHDIQDNMETHNYEVNYIITHCCLSDIQNLLGGRGFYKSDRQTDFLIVSSQKLNIKNGTLDITIWIATYRIQRFF